MDHTYWHKQTADEPLFPDLLWSRPQHKRQAGKLLIVGGNAHGFAAAATAYAEAGQAGIGTARVLLPDSLQKTVGRVFEAGEYAPSTPSGSFKQTALAELLDLSAWADGVLLAGDFGRNSETAILLEKYIGKYSGPLALTGDAVDYFIKDPAELMQRSSTVLFLGFGQLQKLATGAKFTTAFSSQMDFLHLVEALHAFTQNFQPSIVLAHDGTAFVTVDGKVSTTKPSSTSVGKSVVWSLQNPSKPFDALTTAAIDAPSHDT